MSSAKTKHLLYILFNKRQPLPLLASQKCQPFVREHYKRCLKNSSLMNPNVIVQDICDVYSENESEIAETEMPERQNSFKDEVYTRSP